MKKRRLAGAALEKHLTKTVRNLDEFNAETERIIEDTDRMKSKLLASKPPQASKPWDVVRRSWAFALACQGQRQDLYSWRYRRLGVSSAILCGLSLGLGVGYMRR